MTATASNGMVYEGKKYSITNCTELIRFRPDDYGIKARLFTSANHFGFSCNYEIVDGGLRVRDVVTWNPEGDYPPLNGVFCQQELSERGCGGNPGPNRNRKESACTAPSRDGSR